LGTVSVASNTAAGIFSVALSNIPSANASLELQVQKDGAGIPATLKGVVMTLST
jgi:hypothetical protein